MPAHDLPSGENTGSLANERDHPWYGILLSTRKTNGQYLWDARGRILRLTESTLHLLPGSGDPNAALMDAEFTTRRVAGQATREELSHLARSRYRLDCERAAVDPKLSPADRVMLVHRFVATGDSSLGLMLLSNPSLTTEEIDLIAAKPLARALDARMSEHPNCGSARQSALLLSKESSTAKVLPGQTASIEEIAFGADLEILLKDVLSLNAAAYHLSFGPPDIARLVARWYATLDRLAELEGRILPSTPYVDMLIELRTSSYITVGRAGARLCTHPSLSPPIARSLMDRMRSENIDNLWDGAMKEWALLGGPDRTRDWMLIQGMTGQNRLGEHRVLWAAVLSMDETQVDPLDAQLLLRALTIGSSPLALITSSPLEKTEQEQALRRLNSLSALLALIPWSRPLLRNCLTSRNAVVREIGVRGVSIASLNEDQILGRPNISKR